MTDQTIPVEKIRDLLHLWEGFTSDELHHVSAAGVLNELRDLLPPDLPDPLFGARATHPAFGEGIVTSHFPDEEGDVRFMFPDQESNDGTAFQWVDTSTLTFHTPETPEFLETEEDYRSAPEGTIVLAYTSNANAWQKFPNDRWYPSCDAERWGTSRGMTTFTRRVIRWGRGE